MIKIFDVDSGRTWDEEDPIAGVAFQDETNHRHHANASTGRRRNNRMLLSAAPAKSPRSSA
jgi:hypothetical protein